MNNQELISIKINEEELQTLVFKNLLLAEGFDFQSWGIDILTNEQGEVWATEFNNGCNEYPGAEKIIRINAWSIDEIDDENEDREAAILYHANNFTEELIDSLDEYQYANLSLIVFN